MPSSFEDCQRMKEAGEKYFSFLVTRCGLARLTPQQAITVVANIRFTQVLQSSRKEKMKNERFEKVGEREMRDVAGGRNYVHLTPATGLVNHDWLKNAVAKLRANLQVAPPVGPVPH